MSRRSAFLVAVALGMFASCADRVTEPMESGGEEARALADLSESRLALHAEVVERVLSLPPRPHHIGRTDHVEVKEVSYEVFWLPPTGKDGDRIELFAIEEPDGIRDVYKVRLRFDVDRWSTVGGFEALEFVGSIGEPRRDGETIKDFNHE